MTETKYNTATIVRRAILAIALLVYVLLWIYFFYFFTTIADTDQSCGLANAGMLMIVLLTFLAFFIPTLVLFIVNKDKARRDYLVTLLVIASPMLFSISSIILG
jgi:hypothetical protein